MLLLSELNERDFAASLVSVMNAVRAIIAAVLELTTVGLATIVLRNCPCSSKTIFPVSRIEDNTEDKFGRVELVFRGSNFNLFPSSKEVVSVDELSLESYDLASTFLCWKATPTFLALFMSWFSENLFFGISAIFFALNGNLRSPVETGTRIIFDAVTICFCDGLKVGICEAVVVDGNCGGVGSVEPGCTKKSMSLSSNRSLAGLPDKLPSESDARAEVDSSIVLGCMGDSSPGEGFIETDDPGKPDGFKEGRLTT